MPLLIKEIDDPPDKKIVAYEEVWARDVRNPAVQEGILQLMEDWN